MGTRFVNAINNNASRFPSRVGRAIARTTEKRNFSLRTNIARQLARRTSSQVCVTRVSAPAFTHSRPSRMHYARGARNENGGGVPRSFTYAPLYKRRLSALAAVDREHFVSKIAGKLTVRLLSESGFLTAKSREKLRYIKFYLTKTLEIVQFSISKKDKKVN